MAKFNPDKDIPDLGGKVILITGANIGLGRESLHQLVKHNPAKIYLAARNRSKAEATIKEINATLAQDAASQSRIKFLELDLTSFDSIKQAVKTFHADKNDRLDILMNNAGIMGCPAGTTHEGYEIQFGTNHVGHALLTKLLLPTLSKTAKASPDADVRIINLSSAAERFAPNEGIRFADIKTDTSGLGTWGRYGQSKLANILYTRELAKKYPEIMAVSIHPGAIATNLTSGPVASYGSWLYYPSRIIGYLFMKTVGQGALNQLWATAAPRSKDGQAGGIKTGAFYWPVALAGKDSKLALDEKLSERLWEWTEKELQGHDAE